MFISELESAYAYPQNEFPITIGVLNIDAIAKNTTTLDSLIVCSGIGSWSDIRYTIAPNGITSKNIASMFAVSSLESNGDETIIWSKEKGRLIREGSVCTFSSDGILLSAKADVNPNETNSSAAKTRYGLCNHTPPKRKITNYTMYTTYCTVYPAIAHVTKNTTDRSIKHIHL